MVPNSRAYVLNARSPKEVVHPRDTICGSFNFRDTICGSFNWSWKVVQFFLLKKMFYEHDIMSLDKFKDLFMQEKIGPRIFFLNTDFLSSVRRVGFFILLHPKQLPNLFPCFATQIAVLGFSFHRYSSNSLFLLQKFSCQLPGIELTSEQRCNL